MVSVPATVTSLVKDKSNNSDCGESAAATTGTKRITVRRNVGAASPHSQSPTKANGSATIQQQQLLLILDDVWPNSKGLVEKFKFQMLDYKILVTSRVTFRRFGTPCQLDLLDHGPAVALFHHFAQLNHNNSYMPDKKSCSRDSESLDILKDINQKECFMDMGLFLEDQRILVTVLIDMWAELHDLDEDGTKAMAIVHDLITRNLINLIATRKVATEASKLQENSLQ
ncbi:hypothetical protein KIW84_062301 [Lathyrus oleraceus]|uniref:NB-ARC domain-containing protein n=1 Tax=Pisum sativum TaxID=3888 RepID=A0A9D4W5G2_PEA|nr:hypothetical protein KIW84_062301 [Pisum sativum]